MSRQEISLVVGTAGHIDHGKTQLVKAMTGVDCDRLNEEKKRGITIELGFAPLVLPSERVISLIDVPGHDRFIRQMVSGASGVDAVLLVVAADEGVMPQTREHLDILSLLGVQHGIVAITKKDLVDEAMLDLVREDIQMLVAGTFLESAPVLSVSSVTGEGISELKEAFEKLVDEVHPREREGAYFMPIDRSFPVAGFGTVVTGTAYKGSVSPGDEVDVFPSGKKSRVRSVQVHGKSVQTAFAGQRVAMCLSDIDLDEIKRGDVVCARGVYKATDCLDVMLKLLGFVPDPLEHWQRVRLHIGTSDVLARVSMLDGKSLLPGHTAPVQLVLEEPVAVTIGQRFVIRFYSPLRTIGGGEVLVPYTGRPSGKRSRDAERDHILRLSAASEREERIAAVVASEMQLSVSELMVLTQELRKDLIPMLEHLENKKRLHYLRTGDGIVLSTGRYREISEKLLESLKKYHADYAHQKGMLQDDLINGAFSEKERRMGRMILDSLVSAGQIGRDGDAVSLPEFSAADNSSYSDAREKILAQCRSAGWEMPQIGELAQALALPAAEFKSILEQMKKNSDVAILDGTYVLSLELLVPLMERLRAIEGGFTLAMVRDLTGSSRKFVLPVLEYLDGRGLTRRVGEKRIFVRKS